MNPHRLARGKFQKKPVLSLELKVFLISFGCADDLRSVLYNLCAWWFVQKVENIFYSSVVPPGTGWRLLRGA
jgi:hypothetical protein